MTNRRALEALIAEEHRWPADRSNPVYAHLGAWWNNAPLVQECFGGRIDDARDAAPRLPVAAVRGAALRRRGDAPPRRRGRSRGSSTSRSRTPGARPPSTSTAIRSPRTGASRRAYRRRAERVVRDLRPGAGASEVRAHGDGAGALRRSRRHRRRRVGRLASSPRRSMPSRHDVFLLDVGAQPLRDDAHREPRAAARPAAGAESSSCATSHELRPSERRQRRGARHRARGRAARAPRPAGSRSRTTCSTCSRARRGSWRSKGRSARCGSRAGMLELRALAPDGSPVEGFRFDGAHRDLRGAPSRSTRGSGSSAILPPTDDPRWLVPGVFYGENRPVGEHAALSALHARAHDVERHGVGLLVVPRGPLRDPGGVRARRRARHAGAEPARPGRRRLRAAGRPPGDLARLPLPGGAAALQRARRARAARRADLPLAAGRARRAARPAPRTRSPRASSATARPRSRIPSWVSRRGGRRADRLGALALALPARSAAPARDGRVRSRRVRRPWATATACTSLG